MAEVYTIDASVFLNALNQHEQGQPDSFRFLSRVRKLAIPIIVPTLLFPELAAGIARAMNDFTLANAFVADLRNLSHLVTIDLDMRLAMQAAEIAATQRIKGSDSVYVAVAQRFGATLVTRDRQQLEHAASIVLTSHPRTISE